MSEHDATRHRQIAEHRPATPSQIPMHSTPTCITSNKYIVSIQFMNSHPKSYQNTIVIIVFDCKENHAYAF